MLVFTGSQEGRDLGTIFCNTAKSKEEKLKGEVDGNGYDKKDKMKSSGLL